MTMEKSDQSPDPHNSQDPDPYRGKKLDPDPHGNPHFWFYIRTRPHHTLQSLTISAWDIPNLMGGLIRILNNSSETAFQLVKVFTYDNFKLEYI
jgi:hypothetical protein